MVRRLKVRERDIQNTIVEWLNCQPGAFVWSNETGGVYDPRKGVFRTKQKRLKGVSDILGIYLGKPIAIEVKTPRGRMRPDQDAFIEKFVKFGGVAFKACSVEDVRVRLADFRSRIYHAG